MDLSIILLTINEAENIAILVPELWRLFRIEGATLEIVVVDHRSSDGTGAVAKQLGCRVMAQSGPGYAQAIRDGIAASVGDFVIVMDADLSHEPRYALQLFTNRHRADIVINSRYMPGGGTETEPWRDLLSRFLNLLYRTALRLPFREISGGFRIYRRQVLAGMALESRFYEVQEELIIKAHWAGHKAIEIPYVYKPRSKGGSKARIVKYGIHLLKSLWKFCRTRPRSTRRPPASA